MSMVNETLIRDVVAEVLSRLNGGAALPKPTGNGSPCGCPGTPPVPAQAGARGRFGVFQDANDACQAAQEAFLQLQQKGMEARRKIVAIVKQLADANAESWGKLELDETQI